MRGHAAELPPYIVRLAFARVRAPGPLHARHAIARSAALVILAACADGGSRSPAPRPLVMWTAASVARPLRVALDSFERRDGRRVLLESAASLELARRLADLGEAPDVLVVADERVLTTLLVPRHVAWWVRFASNRIVLAWAPPPGGAPPPDSARWWTALERPGMAVGRADPATDPSGYRTLLVFQLAERHYGVPGLARRLLAAAPPRYIRPREADQIPLLQAGELDYLWTYENLARSAGLRYLRLPAAVDLGDPAERAAYARAEVRVPGRALRDSVTFHGEPIVYALTVPRAAPDPLGGTRLTAFLVSPAGRAILRAAGMGALDRPEGEGAVPPVVSAQLGAVAPAARP